MLLYIFYHTTEPNICNFYIENNNGMVIAGSRNHFVEKLGEDVNLSLYSTMKHYDKKCDDNTYPMYDNYDIKLEDVNKNFIKKFLKEKGFETCDGFYFLT